MPTPREVIRVSLPKGVGQQAKRLAQRYGVPRSTWIRQLILQALRQEKTKS